MIGRLCGKILEKSPPLILIDVGGVGYEIEAPMSTFYKLPLDKSEDVVLHTHLVVRDDAHLLFGFSTIAERTFFRTLIKINGVGAKMALAILSGMAVEEFSHCIRSEDATALTRLPGVGKKTAERLIVEMKDKLPEDMKPPNDSVVTAMGGSSVAHSASASAQASAALVSLGYKPVEAAKMVALVKEDGLSTEDIIRLSLKGQIKS